MQLSQYSQHELIPFLDPHYPVVFHHDTRRLEEAPYMLHWHEAVEVLYVTDGECHVLCNETAFSAKKGDMVILDSDCLHTAYALSAVCEYDCLIVDSSFCARMGLSVKELQFERVVRSEAAVSCFGKIREELSEEKRFYKPAVSALVLEFLVYLSRNHGTAKDCAMAFSNRLDMVKETITYIQSEYSKPLTVEGICCHAGFSKYYLCRTFKEITGYTILEYLTITRCRQAERLLCAGNITVSQAAGLCQFHHLSHFSKTYKKYMGVLPRTVKGKKRVEPDSFSLAPAVHRKPSQEILPQGFKQQV